MPPKYCIHCSFLSTISLLPPHDNAQYSSIYFLMAYQKKQNCWYSQVTALTPNKQHNFQKIKAKRTAARFCSGDLTFEKAAMSCWLLLNIRCKHILPNFKHTGSVLTRLVTQIKNLDILQLQKYNEATCILKYSRVKHKATSVTAEAWLKLGHARIMMLVSRQNSDLNRMKMFCIKLPYIPPYPLIFIFTNWVEFRSVMIKRKMEPDWTWLINSKTWNLTTCSALNTPCVLLKDIIVQKEIFCSLAKNWWPVQVWRVGQLKQTPWP